MRREVGPLPSQPITNPRNYPPGFSQPLLLIPQPSNQNEEKFNMLQQLLVNQQQLLITQQ